MARDNYKWDGDSKDERQSEFARSGYSTLNDGEFHSTWAERRPARKRRTRFARVLWPVLVAAGLSAVVLYGVVTHLHR